MKGFKGIMMRKLITFALAAAMLVSVYGCGCANKQEEGSNIVDGKPVVATTVPETETEATTAPTELPGETIAPLENSVEVKSVEANEVPTAETEDEFEVTEVEDGYIRYVGGDTKWGMILPPGTQIGDESEDGSLFLIHDNVVTAIITDKVIELTSVEQAKDYYSDFGEINIDDFTVIREDGKYKGCFFEYQTEDGIRGFAKYVVDGGRSVCAAGINSTMNAAADAAMREAVNSLVIFE